MNFSTKGIEEKGAMSYYITPGVSEVEFLNITGESPEGLNRDGKPRAPFIELEMKLRGAEDTNSTKFRLYTSDSMIERTLKQINHMGTRVVKKQELDNAGENNANVTEYAAKLNNLLSGKSIRMQFNAEEYINSSNEVKIKPAIPNNTWFAEAIEEGAEHPIIPAAISKLKYSKDNQYQNKKVQGNNNLGGVHTSAEKVDLPFE